MSTKYLVIDKFTYAGYIGGLNFLGNIMKKSYIKTILFTLLGLALGLFYTGTISSLIGIIVSAIILVIMYYVL